MMTYFAPDQPGSMHFYFLQRADIIITSHDVVSSGQSRSGGFTTS